MRIPGDKRRIWTIVLVPPQSGEKTRQVTIRERTVFVIVFSIILVISVSWAITRESAMWAINKSQELAQTQSTVVNLLDSVKVLDDMVADERAGILPPRNMVLPVRGRVSSSFSHSRLHPILDVFRAHKGVDLAARYGTPIASPSKGKVKFVGWSVGYGKIVVIQHTGGITSKMAHCAQILVKKGDSVKAGQPVATVGMTGITSGPHLHFEVADNGRTVDPLRFLVRSRSSCAR